MKRKERKRCLKALRSSSCAPAMSGSVRSLGRLDVASDIPPALTLYASAERAATCGTEVYETLITPE